jgi:protein phosphatase inhibitor 2
VLANTLHNSGDPKRRSSSARSAASRRASGSATGYDGDEEDGAPRLKWDEANLYLTEQERSSTMKITEPKTPYAKQYDPSEDAEEMTKLDAENLQVDELDAKLASRRRVDEIPGLDIGEPEVESTIYADEDLVDGEKRVVVDKDRSEEDVGHHGEDIANMSEEEQAKHRKFEELRKKHYEMTNVRDMLGYAFSYPICL